MTAPWLDPSAPVLVVVAHPDDEVLGCGALLSRLADVTVVHVTDGAPRDGADARRRGFPDPAAYAAARRAEAEAGLALAGVPASRHVVIGVADQEASFHLAALARRIEPLLRGARAVLTHAFEGGHPDHDAAAFAVHAAARLLSGEGRAALAGAVPAIVEMPFYRAGPDGWIRQSFVPHRSAGPDVTCELSPEDRDLKRRMAAAHRTQGDVLAGFDLGVERFRTAPPHDFLALPDRLLYERHAWNMTRARWLDLVRDARAALGSAALRGFRHDRFRF